jgi:ankyrin repeat protein
MLASGWGSQRWLSFLFAHGANPNASNSYGETPLFRAIASNRVTATEALLAHGAKVGDAMRIAVNVGDTTIIRILGAHR